jgi:putative nucleotidyltransferase with HDIG domain
MITEFDTYIKESTNFDMFDYLYQLATPELQEEIDKTKNVEQNPYWHPEGNTYNHIKLVTNRLHNCYHDINLDLAGLFHDLGKNYTTEYQEDTKSWTAHGHEEKSAEMLQDYKYFIWQMGGDFNLIEYIVANHMRYKHGSEMRKGKRERFLEHPFFEYVRMFNSADYGGTDSGCKDRPFDKPYEEK